MNQKLKKMLPTINDFDAFVFDFDGVLTNNLVHLDSHGNEWVTCSRSDGLAFDVLRKLGMPAYIISTEKNLVVSARAKKLKIQAIQGIGNKSEALLNLTKKQSYDLSRIFYIGNDINDFNVMESCGYSACPSDSHEKIKEISTFVLNKAGGYGVVRELLEEVLNIDFNEILYSN